MKTIAAGAFKNQCLRIMDRVAETRDPIIVTKRGRPVVQVVPCPKPSKETRSLVGSILHEQGDPFRTGEVWDADLP